MTSPPAARGSQEAGFTQPRVHLLADPCIVVVYWSNARKTVLETEDGRSWKEGRTEGWKADSVRASALKMMSAWMVFFPSQRSVSTVPA